MQTPPEPKSCRRDREYKQPFDVLKAKTGFARALINFDPGDAQGRKGS
jgi:hypothetical protein